MASSSSNAYNEPTQSHLGYGFPHQHSVLPTSHEQALQSGTATPLQALTLEQGLFHIPGDLRHKSPGPSLHLLTLNIPKNDGSANTGSSNNNNGNPGYSPPMSTASSKSDSPASYNDLTPLPSPLISGDNVFKVFNGRSPPTSTISRAPSIRGGTLRYGLDRSSPYQNNYMAQRTPSGFGGSGSASSSFNTSVSPPTGNNELSDDSDCVLTDSTNTQQVLRNQQRKSRVVSEYTPVPMTPPTRLSFNNQPIISPPRVRDSNKPLHVVKRSPRQNSDEETTDEDQDATAQKSGPRAASTGSPLNLMKREESRTSPSKYHTPSYPNAASITPFQKPPIGRSFDSSPESPHHQPEPKIRLPPSAATQKEIDEILKSPALKTLESAQLPTPNVSKEEAIDTITPLPEPTKIDVEHHKPTQPVPIPSFHYRSHDSSPERVFEAYDTNMRKSTWNEIRSLGRGAFSKVLLGKPVQRHLKPGYNAEDYKVAIKIVDMGKAEQHSRERMEGGLKREIDILKAIKFPSLIRMYAFNMDQESALMVLPLCAGGDLFELVANHRSQISVGLARRIFGDIARAVKFLHENNVVHRDIKLENILLNIPESSIFDIEDYDKYPKSIATLTDMGLSRRIDPEDPMLTTRCGSEDYVPPELLMGQPYDGRQTDSWALGVLLYAIMEGRLPFDPPPNVSNRRRGRTAHRIARVEWSWLQYRDYSAPEGTPEGTSWAGAKKIVEGCLQKRDLRLTSSTIADMEWSTTSVNIADMQYPWPFEVSSIFT